MGRARLCVIYKLQYSTEFPAGWTGSMRRILACTGFRLRRGHGVVFLALYLAFLVWAVAKEY